MEIRSMSAGGIQFLAKEEGLILRPYLDSVGIPTIGLGMTFYPDSGKKVTMSDPPLTRQRALDLFKMMLKNFELGVYSVTRDDITQSHFDALVSLEYNIGIHGFKGSTLLKRVNANPNDLTGIETQFLAWKNAGGKPILLGRRKREFALYKSDAVQSELSAEEIYINHIKHIQAQLNKWLKTSSIDEDGAFGNRTKALVKNFQLAKGLDDDGIVGPATLKALNLI